MGRDFSTWINERIEQYDFEEGRDFVSEQGLSSPNLGNAKSRAQRTTEYHLTLDMAKELSMVERTPRGREARRYFIECERMLRVKPGRRDFPVEALQGRMRAIVRGGNYVCKMLAQHSGGITIEQAATQLGLEPEILHAEMKRLRWIVGQYGSFPESVHPKALSEGVVRPWVETWFEDDGHLGCRGRAIILPKGIEVLFQVAVSRWSNLNPPAKRLR